MIFQNACRFALGLAAARAVAGLLDLQHGFWVLLATLTLTRTTSLETWSAVRQALAGTLVGAVLAGGLLALVHDRDTVYALVLPVVMLVAFIAGPLRGLAWAQGGFTLVVATLFAQVSPVTWQLAPVRLVDVLVGSLIGLACGLVAWPRGAGREVRRSMAGLCSAIADAIGYTTARVVDHSGSADCLAINRALVLAQESLAQYHCELRDERAGQPDWPSVLVAGADARRGERLLPGRPGRIAPQEVSAWLRRAADRTADGYRSLARHLHADGEVPRADARPLDIRALLAVAPAVPRHCPDRGPRALGRAAPRFGDLARCAHRRSGTDPPGDVTPRRRPSDTGSPPAERLPLQEQDRGVVVQPAVPALQNDVDQLTERFRGELADRGGPDDGVGEARQAEASATCRAGLGHTIGVQQHPVPGSRASRWTVRGASASVAGMPIGGSPGRSSALWTWWSRISRGGG